MKTKPEKDKDFFAGMTVGMLVSGIIAIGTSGIPNTPDVFAKCTRAGLTIEGCMAYNGWENDQAD